MKELKKQIKEADFHSCYLYYGQEAYLIQLYTERLRAGLMEKEEEMMNVTVFTDKKIAVSSIIDAAQTLPFLAARRLVIVKGSGLFQTGRKDDSEKMASYLSDIPPSTVLLFIEDTVDKRGKLYKAVAKFGSAVEMNGLSDQELSRFMISQCKKSHVVLHPAEAAYFCSTVGGSIENMLLELNKLTAFKGEGGIATNQDIDAVCTKSLDTRIFDLVDACANKKPQIALEIYRNLISRKESPIMVLAMLYRQFKMIFECKALINAGISQGEIAARTGIREFLVRGSLKQGQRFTEERLKDAMIQCLQTDVDIKTGKMNPEMAVELILLAYSAQ